MIAVAPGEADLGGVPAVGSGKPSFYAPVPQRWMLLAGEKDPAASLLPDDLNGQAVVAGGGVDMNIYLLMMTFRVWVMELAVSAVNYFFLMIKVYEPKYGKLKAHQIGMSTRIGYIFVLAYFILFFAKRYTVIETLVAGVFWLLLILAFERVGSFILRRPVREILEGWHINRGFMWPYVLAAYLLSLLIVGLSFHPGQ